MPLLQLLLLPQLQLQLQLDGVQVMILQSIMHTPSTRTTHILIAGSALIARENFLSFAQLTVRELHRFPHVSLTKFKLF